MSCNQDYLDSIKGVVEINGKRYYPAELVEEKFTSTNKPSAPCRVCGSKFTKQVTVDECESCGALK
jgi:hypothetical protein